MKQEPVEEIIISPEETWNIKQNKTSIITKMEHYELSKLLNDSTALKFVTKKIDRSKWFMKQSIFW